MTTLLSASQSTQLGPRRRWAALAVLMFPVLLVSVDNTALSFAVPSLSRDLAPTGNQLLWIIDVYPLVLAALLITMGSLGDRIGRRRILLMGGTGFAAVSALAAFAPDANSLIAARALLGVFGAMLMPATLSLIRNIFTDASERRMAVAIWAAGFSGGAALGPLVGGWLLEHFWWGSVFLIAVPVLLPLLVLGPILLPESRDPNPGPVDLRGIALASLALGSLVFAIKSVAEQPLVALAAVIVGATALAAFVSRMLTTRQPMLDVRLFGNAVFSGALLVNLVSVVAMVGFIYFATQYLQLVAGLSPLTAAWLLVPGLVLTVAAGMIAVPLVRRIGSRRVVMAGLAFNAAGYAVMAVFGHTGSLTVVLLAFGVLSIGVGMSETISNDLALSAVPEDKAGAAAAASETAYEVGAVLGTALLGSLLNLAYRNGLEVPAGISADAADEARSTLGGAFEVATDLPTATADALVDSAVRAFDGGVTWTAGIGFLLSLAALVIARRALRASD
ncbi:MFS transporter [Nocardioides daejeonensis]|uniref:MFS transporter n=1 Tax=Nocardioides daejeonensis TaxID=1046556 RepID=UPI000D75049A|nr:MFS transporter [Nocardioides daejeonensis]